MRLPYAAALDPTTPGRVLAKLLKGLPHERAAALGNPSLPTADLIYAVHDGEMAALYNPALPLALLVGGTYEVASRTWEGEDKATVRAAVECCLFLCLARAVEYAPVAFADDLRGWGFGAICGASRWWNDTGFAIADLRIDERWHEVERMARDDDAGFGQSASRVVEMCCLWLLGRDIDTAYMLALARRLLDYSLPDDALPHLNAAIFAGRLLGFETERPQSDPRQMSLFSTEAA